MDCAAILLVGSDLSRIRTQLVSKGYRVWVASDTREASALLEIFQPRVILTDLPDGEREEWSGELQADPTTREISLVSIERASELLSL